MGFRKKFISWILTIAMVCALVPAFGETARAISGWSGEGAGTPANPYIIDAPEKLAEFRDIVNGNSVVPQNSAACAVVTTNLTIPAGWEPIGTVMTKYTGIFDGGNREIILNGVGSSGVDYIYAGLFGRVGAGGVVKNVVASGNVSARNSDGYAYAGGIVGLNEEGIIRACRWIGDTSTVFAQSGTATAYAGGIAGSNVGGTIIYCCNTAGDIAATGDSANVGGVAGGNEQVGVLTNCFHKGSGAVTANGSANVRAGGIVGFNYNSAKVIYSFDNAGDITANAESCWAGGIAGRNNGEISKGYHRGGTVTAQGTSVSLAGALAGGHYDGGTISDCLFPSEVSSVGALAGTFANVTGLADSAFANVDLAGLGWENDWYSSTDGPQLRGFKSEHPKLADTWDELYANLRLGGYIKLVNNATFVEAANTGRYLTVPAAVDAYLDLNGKTINRNFDPLEQLTNGRVMAVEGRLKLSDSSAAKTGKITGGKSENGAGVYVVSGGLFNMTGGTIRDNVAMTNGGGVYVADGAKLTLSGDATITDNTKYLSATQEYKNNNVYLPNGGTISIGDNLTGTVGVTMETAGVFTKGLSGNGAATNFASDDTGISVEITDAGEAKLIENPATNNTNNTRHKRRTNVETVTTPEAETKVEPEPEQKPAQTMTTSELLTRYSDLVPGAWYIESVLYVVDKGIMQGTDKGFEPNAKNSRAMIAQMLFNLDGAAAGGNTAAFDDVKPGDWYAAAVTWLVEKGIARGEGANFGANKPITREQLAMMLYGYAQYKGYDVSAKGDLNAFPDVAGVSGYAQEALAWAVGTGIISGTTDESGAAILDAQGSATRAQVAAMFMRFCENIAK